MRCLCLEVVASLEALRSAFLERLVEGPARKAGDDVGLGVDDLDSEVLGEDNCRGRQISEHGK